MTTDASRRSRAISRPQRPRDTKECPSLMRSLPLEPAWHRLRFLCPSADDYHYPVLPFLVFWISLFFLLARISLFFRAFFVFFSRDFRGLVGIKNPCFFGGFPCLFPKKQGKEGQGTHKKMITEPNLTIFELFSVIPAL